jgi:predicted DsbA family dithiol-disulfide isomerase
LNARLRWLPFELHPETPPEGAPKPVPPEAWPAVRERLHRFADAVGLPIDPPERNLNSRFALETGELIRERSGDDAAGKFHFDVSRAFFAERADISKIETIVPIAERYGVVRDDVMAAWHEHRYAWNVDDFMEAAFAAGVSGVPAIGWPQRIAVVGMREPDALVALLERTAPG